MKSKSKTLGAVAAGLILAQSASGAVLKNPKNPPLKNPKYEPKNPIHHPVKNPKNPLPMKLMNLESAVDCLVLIQGQLRPHGMARVSLRDRAVAEDCLAAFEQELLGD